MSCVYQIALWHTDTIWLVHTVQGPNCHKIIICHRNALVCGNEGTPNLAIYATFNSTAGGIWALVSNSPWTHISNMAGTYSAGSELPWNHNLPQGSPRLRERQHSKLGHICDFDSTVRRVYQLYEPNSPWTHGPNMAGTYSWGPNCNKSIICQRDALDYGNEGTPNLAINAHDFSFHSRGYMSFMHQIALGTSDPIWPVHKVQGPNCHEIIICHRPPSFVVMTETQTRPLTRFWFHSKAGIWAIYTK